jgi:phosphate transport system protein
MMRNKFNEQLKQLNEMLIEMGALAERSIAIVTHALKKQDAEMAKGTVALEKEIDEKEKEIEALCMRLLLQQQPVARDLRLISAALKMITDLERIGDQARDISELTILLSDKIYIKEIDHIPQMAAATVKMVTDSIESFVKRDVVVAYSVIESDDIVDDLFKTVRGDLIDLIRSDSADGEQIIDLLMIAKYFERIGDHAVNVCEWVVFAITGKHPSY